MKTKNNLKHQLEQLAHEITPDSSLRHRVMEQIEALPDTRRQAVHWRLIMKKTWKPLSSIAAALLLYVGWTLLFSHSTPATYALEQTLTANRHILSIHMKYEPHRAGSMDELWAEFSNGQLKRMRYNFTETIDGPKDVIWQGDEARVWFRSKKAVGTFKAQNQLEQMRMPYDMFDPNALFAKILQDDKKGQIILTTTEPDRIGDPVLLTVTDKDRPDQMRKYRVNAKTKLVESMETYKQIGDGYEFQHRCLYLDYNKPISEKLFQFELPDDVIQIDWIRQEIGLARGDLSETEICQKVVRAFIQALIEKDYSKAGQLFSGGPAEQMQKYFGVYQVQSIVSVGTPKPHPSPGVGGYQVPFTAELDINGKIELWKRSAVAVRESRDQPGQWYIHGGI